LLDPPGRPGIIECVGTTEDSIALSWEPPAKDGGKPVKKYILEKREKGSKKWTKYLFSDSFQIHSFIHSFRPFL